jgi:putative membrane protein
MSTPRKPAAFRLDDPQVVVAPREPSDDAAPPSPRGANVLVTPAPDAPVPAVIPAIRRRRRFAWATVFWSALGALTLLGLGLAVTGLIEDLAARSTSLGALGLALAIVAALALVAILTREAVGLARLAVVEKLHACPGARTARRHSHGAPACAQPDSDRRTPRRHHRRGRSRAPCRA